MTSDTLKRDWLKLAVTDETFTTLGSCSPTLVKPSGDGIVVIPGIGKGEGPNLLQLEFFGHPGNSSFSWRINGVSEGSDSCYYKTPLAAGTGSIGIQAGASTATLCPSSDSFCTTLTVTFGNSNVNVETLSPADGLTSAMLVLDMFGHQFAEVQLASGVTSIGLNGLYKTL